MPTRGWVYWREQREEGRLGRPLKLLKDVKSNCDLLTGLMLVMHNLVGLGGTSKVCPLNFKNASTSKYTKKLEFIHK